MILVRTDKNGYKLISGTNWHGYEKIKYVYDVTIFRQESRYKIIKSGVVQKWKVKWIQNY